VAQIFTTKVINSTQTIAPHSVNNYDMIRDKKVQDTYKEANFCYSGCTYKGVNYTTNYNNCKQTPIPPQQEIEHKANKNKVIQTLSHLRKTVYNVTNLTVFLCYNNTLNVYSYMNNIVF
jgi:hypothetical protein